MTNNDHDSALYKAHYLDNVSKKTSNRYALLSINDYRILLIKHHPTIKF